MDPSQPAGSRRRTTAIIAAAGLACLAIAIPVSGAFGADESPNNGAAAQQQQGGQGYGQPPGAYGQGQPPSGERAPDGNCPKGEGSGQSQDNSGDSSGPALQGDSLAL
jgi:hypothetical protein